jgi:hypothetical protein
MVDPLWHLPLAHTMIYYHELRQNRVLIRQESGSSEVSPTDSTTEQESLFHLVEGFTCPKQKSPAGLK